MYQTSDDII